MIESEILFTDLLGCDRTALYLNQDRYLNKHQSDFLVSVLKRRAKGEPLQYILAKTAFMGLEFRLTNDVLIPRPETEILVETALRYFSNIDMALQILEVGSGSGCIAISLAKVLSNCIIDAIDISQGALKVAKKNSRLHKVKINFMPSDLFSNQKLNDSNYDLIISNPPYIPTEEIKKLQPEIRFEPDVALDGGSDGLDFFRRIIAESPRYLKDRGLLMIEIGFNQKYAVRDIISKSSALEIIETVKDYRGFERVIVAKKR